MPARATRSFSERGHVEGPGSAVRQTGGRGYPNPKGAQVLAHRPTMPARALWDGDAEESADGGESLLESAGMTLLSSRERL